MHKYRVPQDVILQRYDRISNNSAYKDEQKRESIVHLPGLSFTHFSRAGVPTAFALARLTDTGGRKIVSSKGKPSQKDIQMVVLGQSVSITPYFHQRARIIFPITLRTRYIHVGNSSFTVEETITDAENGDILLNIRRMIACMNVSTGASERMTENFRRDLMEKVSTSTNEKPEIMKDFQPRPANHFSYSIFVRHSDTDWLYHSNQASYFTYCMDAATEGAKNGHFRLLKGDLLSYTIESMECLYKGESLPGDELKVSVWENSKNPLQLFSQIEKRNKIIWTGKMGFRSFVNSKI